MKIRNIDPILKIEQVQKVADTYDFILETINSAFPKEYEYFLNKKDIIQCNPSLSSPIYKFAELNYHNIANLIHTIPIYLKAENNEEKTEKDNNDNNENKIDTLGAYFSNKGNHHKGSPYIEMYLNTIEQAANNQDEYKWLFTKVLIHELAHAALDIYNWEPFSGTNMIPYNSKFGKWREESAANAVTLKIIKNSGNKKFYSFAKKFIKNHQSKEYQLGILMENFAEYTFQSVLHNKIHGTDGKDTEWYEYVQGKTTAKGLEKWDSTFLSIK